MADLEGALKAIIARVEFRFDDPALDPFREIIQDGDESGEWCCVDCKLIAQAALGIDI